MSSNEDSALSAEFLYHIRALNYFSFFCAVHRFFPANADLSCAKLEMHRVFFLKPSGHCIVVLRSKVNMETGSRKEKFGGNRIRSN